MLSFQESDANFHLKLLYTLVFKRLVEKLYQGQNGLTHIIFSSIL